MITKDNLPDLLTLLGFHKSGAVYRKPFGEARLAVNLDKGEIIYPVAQGLVANESQTCNFSANENFVVFECKRLVAEVERLEKVIATAQSILTAAPGRKQAILQRYL